MKWLIQLVDNIPYKKSVTIIIEAQGIVAAISIAHGNYPELGFCVKAIAIPDLDVVTGK